MRLAEIIAGAFDAREARREPAVDAYEPVGDVVLFVNRLADRDMSLQDSGAWIQAHDRDVRALAEVR